MLTWVFRQAAGLRQAIGLRQATGLGRGAYIRLWCSNDKIMETSNTLLKQGHKNSIQPSENEYYAYGHFFPKHWDENQIQKILDPTHHHLQHIQVIKNSIGEPTGKILLQFASESSRMKFIQKYNQEFVMTDEQTQRVVILPFELKTQECKKVKRSGKNLRNPVRVSNLDFDISPAELKKLADDYGEVSHIDMSMRQKGINLGFATVYFETKKSAAQFVNFIDGFLYRDRKLKGHVIEKPVKSFKQQQQAKYLDVPTYTFKANEELRRRLQRKRYEATSKSVQQH